MAYSRRWKIKREMPQPRLSDSKKNTPLKLDLSKKQLEKKKLDSASIRSKCARISRILSVKCRRSMTKRIDEEKIDLLKRSDRR